MSESQEIAMGKEAVPEIAASMGIYGDDELQKYVEAIGLRMAALSERPHLPWQFRVIDDSAVNAFAVPGGFIYITRGILAHMGSEAELASVVGHEIGHVTARHSVQQMTRQQLAQAGLGIGMIGLAVVGAGELGQMLGQAAGAGAQLLFLKYGRDDETQADDLGFKYMIAAGYAPTEMPHMFHTLARQTEAMGARVPEWQSTHPAPANREGRIKQKIEKLPAEQHGGKIESDAFLAHVDGIMFGADPRAGYFDSSNVFHHPELGFRLVFPKGWKTQNHPDAVVGMSEEQDAAIQLTLAKEASAEEAADAFFSQQGIQAGRQSSNAVNGLNAVSSGFGASTQQGGVQGRVTFVELDKRVFQLVGFAPQASFQANSKAISEGLASFARETDAKFLNVKAWRVQVVKPTKDLTIQEFAQTYPGPVSAEDLAIMNQVDAGGLYKAGVPVKRVVGTKLP
jgi:predicted Zn-dependent protease